MPKTFLDYYNELIGYSGGSLDPHLAKTLVQRAHRDILNARTWSFLMTEGVLHAPQLINTGTVSVTQFSNTVVADPTAKDALDAVSLDLPLGRRQFRVGNTDRIYNIEGYDDSTGALTLKEPYTEPSNAITTYSVFQCYYSPPRINGLVDFYRFLTIRDLTNGRTLRLNVQKMELDRRDPQRTVTEPPILLCAYKSDSEGNPLFELWPHPTSARAYLCLFCRRGTELEEDTDTLIHPIDDELLMTRAQYHLAKWAEMNKGVQPNLRATDWRFLMSESTARYEKLLLDAKKDDDEIFVQNVMLPKPRFGNYPPSASALQERDYWW